MGNENSTQPGTKPWFEKETYAFCIPAQRDYFHCLESHNHNPRKCIEYQEKYNSCVKAISDKAEQHRINKEKKEQQRKLNRELSKQRNEP